MIIFNKYYNSVYEGLTLVLGINAQFLRKTTYLRDEGRETGVISIG